MKLQFKVQQYQTEAVNAVVDVFTGQPYADGVKYRIDPGKDAAQTALQDAGLRNAEIALTPPQLLTNVHRVQQARGLELSKDLKDPVKKSAAPLNLDIEMETGTGKTYVYIKTIMELHKRFGWSKYIVVVPSIAIREGVKKSFDITAEHFQQLYGTKPRAFVYSSSRLHELERFSSDSGVQVSAPARLKNPSSRKPRKMSPVMCLVGGIHLSGASGNSCRASRAWASSRRKLSGMDGSISKAWPSPICQRLEARLGGEGLVEQLADRDGVGGLDGVGRREVVVLAGVDDDAGAGMDLAAEALVDEGADRVDVAEEDAVHRVVEHHVEPLEAGQGGDLGHAQPARVVGQPDVAAEVLARLVEGGPHEPEVLLGGVRAREALAGGAFGHVVQEGLARGADDGDDVGALPRRGLGLRDVLVDVPSGDDEVDPRLALGIAVPADQPVAGRPLAVDGADAARRPPPGPPCGRRWRPWPRGDGTTPSRWRPSGTG